MHIFCGMMRKYAGSLNKIFQLSKDVYYFCALNQQLKIH